MDAWQEDMTELFNGLPNPIVDLSDTMTRCQTLFTKHCPVIDKRKTQEQVNAENIKSQEIDAAIKAKPTLLEPIYNLEVIVPEEFMGDVMGDLSSRRGRILGMDREGNFQKIKASCPLAELYKYSTSLRSMTQGRGLHRREFSHYEEVPREIADKLIKEAQQEKEAQQK